MERNITQLLPKDLITNGQVNEAVQNWARSWEKKYSKAPTQLSINRLEAVIKRVVLPLTNRDRRFDIDQFKVKNAKERLAYIEITEGMTPHDRSSLLTTAKRITSELADKAMVDLRHSVEPLVGVPGDPKHTDPKRGLGGVKGGASYASWDEGANVKGYDQGIEEAN